MKNVCSCMFATSNENGLNEVEIKYNRTLWQSLLRKPGRVERWIRRPVPSRSDYAGWFNKESGVAADATKGCEIMELMEWARISSWQADDRYSTLKAP